MSNGTRAPSGVIENAGFLGLAAAIGVAINATWVSTPEWQHVVTVAAPIVGKGLQMAIASLRGENLLPPPARSDLGVKVIAALTFGLAFSGWQPAAVAQDAAPVEQLAEAPAFGCGGGTCSIYVVSASWPPALSVNAVEFVRGAFGVGPGGVHADGDLSWMGGLCLIPKVGPALGPACPQAGQ